MRTVIISTYHISHGTCSEQIRLPGLCICASIQTPFISLSHPDRYPSSRGRSRGQELSFPVHISKSLPQPPPQIVTPPFLSANLGIVWPFLVYSVASDRLSSPLQQLVSGSQKIGLHQPHLPPPVVFCRMAC